MPSQTHALGMTSVLDCMAVMMIIRAMVWMPFRLNKTKFMQADSSPLGHQESPYKGYLEEVRQFLLRGWVKDSLPGA